MLPDGVLPLRIHFFPDGVKERLHVVRWSREVIFSARTANSWRWHLRTLTLLGETCWLCSAAYADDLSNWRRTARWPPTWVSIPSRRSNSWRSWRTVSASSCLSL